MKSRQWLFVAAVIGVLPTLLSAAEPVTAAAKRAEPSVTWHANSVLSGDFSCQGRREFAILGTSKKHIVVAIFGQGLHKPMDVLRLSANARNAAAAVLTLEPLDFDPEEFAREVGAVPDGLMPSKTCMGLNLSDRTIDSAHIYWHRSRKRLASWSR